MQINTTRQPGFHAAPKDDDRIAVGGNRLMWPVFFSGKKPRPRMTKSRRKPVWQPG